jgi:hypothetical protein
VAPDSTNDSALRQHLLDVLHGGNAHATFDDAVNDFPAELAGVRPEGSPHSAWELIEHIRIALEDILRFSRSADHKSPPWPRGYWPNAPEPGPGQWDDTVAAIRKDLGEFESMVRDPEQDLFRKLPWGEGQTLLREALLIADHNAYHVGQLVIVRRLLGAWE